MKSKTISENLGNENRPAGMQNAKLLPGALQKRAKLLIIDNDPEKVGALRNALGNKYDVLSCSAVSSLDEAIGQVRKCLPDAILCTKNFDGKDKNAPLKLLIITRSENSRAKVFLRTEGHCEEDSADGFDAVVHGETDEIAGYLVKLASSDDDAIPVEVDDESTKRRRLAHSEESIEWESRIQTNVEKKKKLLVIDNDQVIVTALNAFLSDLCIVHDAKPVCSLERAIDSVKESGPDIVIIFGNFDKDRENAASELCELIKSVNANTKVILLSNAHLEAAEPFDAIVSRNEGSSLKEIVKDLVTK